MRGVSLRGAVAWAAALLIGIVLGAASAWAALEMGRANFSENYGGWSHSRAAGSRAADPYTRAIIARDGLLALNANEALYFSMNADENGRPLHESCIYELSGGDVPARWWSVTLYASDNFLARNGDHAESIDSTRVHGPAWRARISPVRGEAVHWLSSRSAGRKLVLMLRIYNPHDGWRPSADALPTLTTLSCAGDSA
jgi:hypothetical protein